MNGVQAPQGNCQRLASTPHYGGRQRDQLQLVEHAMHGLAALGRLANLELSADAKAVDSPQTLYLDQCARNAAFDARPLPQRPGLSEHDTQQHG